MADKGSSSSAFIVVQSFQAMMYRL